MLMVVSPAIVGTIIAQHGSQMGIAILPDYSISADPLVKSGIITTRPIHGDTTTISLLMLCRKAEHMPVQLRGLQAALVRHAAAYRSIHSS